ncbi:MAG: hypothetical protein PHC54_04830 [Candidatus Omnitrophica bacterium]|nr:hypothetical protein [Candidatus Omnitrophota bacterium]MDD5592602.1 hypothetical protein [Candidatus Omnitrophota bacterium]
MPLKKTARAIVFLAALVLLSSGIAFAYDDGFGSAKKIEGKYFTIYYPSQLESSVLIQKLNMGASDNLMAGKSAPYEVGLADMLDTLFIRVSDILDMHIYSFHGTVKVCENKAQLGRIYKDIVGRELNTVSFFVTDMNTIYIMPDSFKREVLGHEMSHSLMSRYFVVQPPEKIHELLAMYVEYQLRKGSQ